MLATRVFLVSFIHLWICGGDNGIFSRAIKVLLTQSSVLGGEG